ncbi:hypothetical protein [Sandarakinorhabdus sp.]|uniref:hypothetical protein n=1 Tax=Sandarakinorhabdus sp. TaxID=1916663 RepID=UPI003F6F0A37
MPIVRHPGQHLPEITTRQPISAAPTAIAAFEEQFGGRAIIVRLPDPPFGGATSIADFLPPGVTDTKRGLHALDKADTFNLLCSPPQHRHRRPLPRRRA